MSVEISITDQIVEINEVSNPVEISVTAGAATAPVWGNITGTLSNQTDLQNALDAKVPYTGATANVNLGEFELRAGQLTLDTTPTGTAGVGTTRWNDTLGSTETTLKGGSVILKNGVDLVARVVNKVSPNTTLTKAAYQAVRISGAQGQRLAVELAQANNDNNSADTIGLVTETIAANQEGFIMTVGSLEGINTTGSLQGETWVDGDVLYLSPTIAGRITNVKPIAPQHLVVIGYVEYAHANNGKIYVKVMNGWELGELHDVNTTGAVAGQVLKYNGTIWTPSSDAGITGTGVSGQVAYWSGTNTQTGSNNLFWDATNSRLRINTQFVAGNEQTFNVYGSALFQQASGDNNKIYIGNNTSLATGDGRLLITPFRIKLNSSGGGLTISADNLDTGSAIYLNTRNQDAGSLSLAAGNNVALAIFGATRNIAIQNGGTFTDSGQRLQVTGDTLMRGSGNTSATTALIVENSDGSDILKLRNDGVVLFGNSANAAQIRPVNASGLLDLTGEALAFIAQTSTNNASIGSFNLTGFTLTSTSGFNTLISIYRTFSPTSGTAQATYVTIVPTINQTGGASGITRGINISPVLTAAADWRSIEWSNNTGWGLYGAGTANNYLAGGLAIGGTNVFAYLHVQGLTTGTGNLFYTLSQPTINSALSELHSFRSNIIGNSAVTVTNAYYYSTRQSSLGSSSITNQYGFFAEGTLTGATNNFGFYGNIPSGTGRWNLYMNGTASNYLAGSLGIGTTTINANLHNAGTTRLDGNITQGGNPAIDVNFYMLKSLSGSVYPAGIFVQSAVSATSTTGATYFSTNATTQAASFTLPVLEHFKAQQGSFGAGSTVTNQFGFRVSTNLTGASNNYGFYSEIAASANRWNFYAAGTALNYFNGNTIMGTLAADSGEKLQVNGTMKVTGASTFSSTITSTQFRLSALNTAPATSSSTGTLGEIRIDADYIYICTATNTWKRVAIATW
ncbi:hypothetical protein UFOVP316_46 [uncultured Caudovirales phage]|uniref:Tail fiber protein n=1 Tax=uncultured Caudovirales phage TaxID=2100421 RepID=A0A6J5LWG7_9CAUD|nr:hypothetical protein UFOVP316_46 [uncultured Caudovirales phage]